MRKIRLDAERILSIGNWKAWFGRINEFIHWSPLLPAARLPTHIYANFTITKGKELCGLFNKPVILDNISNGFHGSGKKNSRWIKGWNVCTSPEPCFLLWGVQQNDWICQTDLMDEHNSQSLIQKRKQAGFVMPWMCWNAKHSEMPLLCKCDPYKGEKISLCERSGHMARHPFTAFHLPGFAVRC